MRPTLLACLALLTSLAACTRDVPALVDPDAPASIRVNVSSERGRPDARLPFSLVPAPISVDIEVLGQDGSVLTGFDGSVEVRIEPGDVVRVELADGSSTIGPEVPITGGVARGVDVYVAKAYADARIWAEEIGYVPGDPATAQCANGIDDDGDRLVDLARDPGCRYANDDDERAGSHAAGVSDLLYFANPHLADVQGYTGLSPLQGRLVRVDSGEMIVTRITTDGFYVSEIEHDAAGLPTGRAVPWGSAFAFNFNTPPFLRTCDRIIEVSGSVGEFFGFTELNQPSWRRERWCSNPPDPETCRGVDGHLLTPRDCPIPSARVLTPDVLGTPEMESLEASLVRAVDARIASRFGSEFPPMGSNCDLNGDGDVSFDDPAEDACNTECERDPECSEWNTYSQFGQFIVQTAGGVLNVVTQDSVPDFDPVAHRGETFAAFTGTLRNFAPLGPQRGYILEPRCVDDITPAGEMPKPSSSACVVPRTGGAIEPD